MIKFEVVASRNESKDVDNSKGYDTTIKNVVINGRGGQLMAEMAAVLGHFLYVVASGFVEKKVGDNLDKAIDFGDGVEKMLQTINKSARVAAFDRYIKENGGNPAGLEERLNKAIEER